MQPQFSMKDVLGHDGSGLPHKGRANHELLTLTAVAPQGGRREGPNFVQVDFFTDGTLQKPASREDAQATRITAGDHTGTSFTLVAEQGPAGVDISTIQIEMYKGGLHDLPAADQRVAKILKAVSSFDARLNPSAPTDSFRGPRDGYCLGEELAKQFGSSNGHTIAERVLNGATIARPKGSYGSRPGIKPAYT